MDKSTDPVRNLSTEGNGKEDPGKRQLRDETAIQPGVSTISSSDTDEANQELTRTAADDFRQGDDSDRHADPAFDEVGKD